MSFQDSSAKFSNENKFDNFKMNIDSHYDFFKEDPDYGLFINISNIN